MFRSVTARLSPTKEQEIMLAHLQNTVIPNSEWSANFDKKRIKSLVVQNETIKTQCRVSFCVEDAKCITLMIRCLPINEWEATAKFLLKKTSRKEEIIEMNKTLLLLNKEIEILNKKIEKREKGSSRFLKLSKELYRLNLDKRKIKAAIKNKDCFSSRDEFKSISVRFRPQARS